MLGHQLTQTHNYIMPQVPCYRAGGAKRKTPAGQGSDDSEGVDVVDLAGSSGDEEGKGAEQEAGEELSQPPSVSFGVTLTYPDLASWRCAAQPCSGACCCWLDVLLRWPAWALRHGAAQPCWLKAAAGSRQPAL